MIKVNRTSVILLFNRGIRNFKISHIIFLTNQERNVNKSSSSTLVEEGTREGTVCELSKFDLGRGGYSGGNYLQV